MATYANAKFIVSPSYSAGVMTKEMFLSLTDFLEAELVGQMPAFGSSDEFTTYETVTEDYADADKAGTAGTDTTVEMKFKADSPVMNKLIELAKTPYKYPVGIVFDDKLDNTSTRTCIFTRVVLGGPAFPAGGRKDTITATFAMRQVQREIILPAAKGGTVVANTVAPVAAGTGSTGNTLTVTSAGEWSGSDLKLYTYQWQADGADIDGATASSFVVTADEVGTDVTCVVTATNDLGSASVSSNAITVS